ncbi:malto-oligosyltrehalose synthase [Actinomycetota bacterium]
MTHRPATDRPVPVSTYRLQITPSFGFADAAGEAAYLHRLGVSHAYLSPILRATEGSEHGYDVIDHGRLNRDAGGRKAFQKLRDALSDKGLGVIADVVPNHMAVPEPEWRNRQLWDVLKHGRESRYARWFDIDWDAGPVLLPLLGDTLDNVLRDHLLQIATDGGESGDEAVLRYYDHEFPLRPGTEGMPLAECVAAQHYRLSLWRDGQERLTYRRFFDVTSLIAVRVEDPEVFDATHELLLELMHQGRLDGLRIDHPDGLADPRGYLKRLAKATNNSWVVVEKILEGEERLPDDWHCAGTTGYDALLRVGGVFVDPAGEAPLTRLWDEWGGQGHSLDEVIASSKAYVARHVLPAELARLVRTLVRLFPQFPEDALRRSVRAMLVSVERYRAYVVPGEKAPEESVRVLDEAYHDAKPLVQKWDKDALKAVRALAVGDATAVADVPDADALVRDFQVRFQQTCGPVVAKGVEDTAFYRYYRLVGLNEVGGDPGRFGISPDELHEFFESQQRDWPTTQTTLTTHDTKRSEDVRSRLAVISELPAEWSEWVAQAHELAEPHRTGLDRPTEYLLWQTLVGAWLIDADRAKTYATKAIREAKLHTAWVDGDPSYEQIVMSFLDGALADPAVTAHIEAWVERTATATRSNLLGQKLVQLTGVGVPDVYQGTEVVQLTLVDPDNRAPVDFAALDERLVRLDKGKAPKDVDDEKLLVTSRALRLRREHPKWFVGDKASYVPVPTTSPHALAFARGKGDEAGCVTVVTRMSESLSAAGGFGDSFVRLPKGTWRDLLTDTAYDSAKVPLGELLSQLPVALLVREH